MSLDPLNQRGPSLGKRESLELVERQQRLKWLVFSNLTGPEFRKSRYGLYGFLLLPTAVRAYFFFVTRGRYLRPLLFYSALASSASYFSFAATRDLDAFLKQDTKLSNKMLSAVLDESRVTQRSPDYSELVYEKHKKRLAVAAAAEQA